MGRIGVGLAIFAAFLLGVRVGFALARLWAARDRARELDARLAKVDPPAKK